MNEGLLQEILTIVREFDHRLTALEEKVETRLYDTRPLWETVIAKLDELEKRFDRLEERTGRIEERMGRLEERMDRLETAVEQFRDETREQLAHISHQMEILTLDVMDVRAKQRSLDKRVTSLENPPVS